MWNDLLVVLMYCFSILFSVPLVGKKPADQEDDKDESGDTESSLSD